MPLQVKFIVSFSLICIFQDPVIVIVSSLSHISGAVEWSQKTVGQTDHTLPTYTCVPRGAHESFLIGTEEKYQNCKKIII